jgi:MFS family permease
MVRRWSGRLQTVSVPSSLWRNSSFNWYWLGRVASDFGDTLAAIALPLVILQITGSLVWMGTITALQSAGGWFGSLAAAAIADRFDRRSLLIACDVAQALLYAVITWDGIRGTPEIRDLLLVCTPILAALAALFDATTVPFIDQVIASPAERISANARIQATRSLAGLVAPLTLGWLVDRWGAYATLGLNAVSFAVSAVTLAMVRPRYAAPERAASLSLRELSRGFRFIFKTPLFCWIVMLSAIYRALGSSANDLMIFHVTRNLSLHADAVGTLVMAIGIGYVLGSLVVARLRQRLGFGVCFLGSFAISAACLVILGGSRQLTAMAFAAGLYGAAFMFYHVPSLTLRQELPPASLQGRVAGATGVIFVTANGIGAAGGSAVGEWIGVPWTMALLAAGCILLFLVGLCSPTRARNPVVPGTQPRPG